MPATLTEARETMEARIPHGTASDIALFTTLPNRQGVGAVEVDSAWYAREAAEDWRTEVVGGVNVRRVNSAQIAFPATTEDITIVGWGLYENGTDNLRYWGPLRDAGGNILPVSLSSGDNLVWAAGDFVAHSITPAFTFTNSVMQEIELNSAATTDATPIERDIRTLEDGEQIRMEVVITATDGSTKHYERRILSTFYRSGVSTRERREHESDHDGVPTRNNLTTATADLIVSGHTVQAQMTGEAATNLEWIVTAEIRSNAT